MKTPLLALTMIFTACASPPPEPFHGEWRVVAFTPAGIAALTEEDASAWVGTVARYYPNLAWFGVEGCSSPSYSRRTLDVAHFYEEFRTHPKDLKLSEGPFTVIDIACDGAWIAPGSTLILKSSDRLLTLWDGMFFELARR